MFANKNSNYMKKLITTALATLCTIVLLAQIPQAFKYQAVIRNNQGKVLVNQVVSLRISILQNDPLGDMVYVETHQIATNDYGIANISIGSGTVITGVFADIPWGTTTHFVKTELDITGNQNYEFIGTSQLLSVPYALYAAKAGNVADDLDKDPTNEIQAISFSNDTVYLSNGGKVYLGKYTDNTDSQSLQINGNTLSISGGNSVTFAGAVDLDADPINELQALSYSNDTIYLSKGNFVVLPHNWDNDSTNELQTVTQNANMVTLSKNGGTIDINDNDSDPLNEIQQISKNDNQIILSNGGSITLNDDDPFNEIQQLSISNDTIFLSKSNSIILPHIFENLIYKDKFGRFYEFGYNEFEQLGWNLHKNDSTYSFIHNDSIRYTFTLNKADNWTNANNFCNDLDTLSYNDWYLPDLDELISMYNQKEEIKIITNKNYWSNTPTDTKFDSFYIYKFDVFQSYDGYTNGKQGYAKSGINNFQCIRKSE